MPAVRLLGRGEFFAQFDNSSENKGLPGSSPDIGPGWAYASATPLRLFKGYVAQGGIQVPAIVKPAGGTATGGTRITELTHMMDLMPTFLEVAGARYPDVWEGRALVPLQGRSMVGLLRGERGETYADRELFGTKTEDGWRWTTFSEFGKMVDACRAGFKQLGVKEDEVTPNASFVDDLGADSLDTVELVMALEEEFECEIPDEEAEKITSVQQAIDYINSNAS